MRKFVLLILAIGIILSLAACSSEKEALNSGAFETAGIVGVKSGQSMRFDDFGLTIQAPDGCEVQWGNGTVPETFSDLDRYLQSEEYYMVTWTDFDTDGGDCNFSAQVMPCEEGMTEMDVLNYFLDVYSKEQSANPVEIRKLELGDHPGQKCFVTEFVNDEGQKENLVIFEKVSGKYYIECAARTYGWEGAEDLARKIFYLDEPQKPTQYETSGVLGVMEYDTLRFDDFGLSIQTPDDATEEEWAAMDSPKTFEELDSILQSNDCYQIFSRDVETAEGIYNLSAQVMRCDAAMTEADVMEYFLEYYLKELSADPAEVRRLELGDNPAQKCFVTEFTNQEGVRENLLVFDKISGNYYIECSVSTYGWNGAEDLAGELFILDKPAEQKWHETSGILGFFRDDALRFEDFGLSVNAPDLETGMEWENRKIPETYEALDEILGTDGYYELFWENLSTDKGEYSISAGVMPNSADASENLLLDWQKDYYLEEGGASKGEIATLSLGDHDAQKCMIVTFKNDEGKMENLLTIYKTCGNYRLECNVRTYDWEGAVELARELITVDEPKKLPFTVSDSGFFLLEDTTLFGKTVDEVSSQLGISIAEPVEFPWWDMPLTYAVVDSGNYPVTLVFDNEGKLYVIMCEEVADENAEAVFQEVKSTFGDFYCCINATSSFYTDGVTYRFPVDDNSRFNYARCTGDNGSKTLSQRYYAGPLSDTDLAWAACGIAEGQITALDLNYARELIDYVTNRSPDSETMMYIGQFYEIADQDHEKAIEWFNKAIAAGNTDAMVNLGYLYETVMGDMEQAMEWYEKAANAGNVTGMYNMGCMCSAVLNDSEKALEWFEKAAALGDLNSKEICADAYSNGTGTDTDCEKPAG